MKSIFRIGFLIKIISFSGISYAEDINFITPSDLPKEAFQSFNLFGRVKPSISKSEAVSLALKKNWAEISCGAKVGEQITDWVEKIEQTSSIYWEYEVSAKFRCLEPKTTLFLSKSESEIMRNVLKKTAESESDHLSAAVVCYQSYIPLCIDSSLRGHKSSYTCELQELYDAQNKTIIEDITDYNIFEKNEGALALMNALPVINDTRRDDDPANSTLCGPHKWGLLKGIYRKSAIVQCDPYSCTVQGIIDPKSY